MKRIINTMFVSFALVCMSVMAYAQTDIIPTACATESFNVADGDSFFDPSDGTNGGPGGDCTGTSSGDPGDYPNAGCVTTTTLVAPGNLSLTFNDFGVFATFDWIVLTDVGTGTVLYDNRTGGANAGDQFLADMMASAGTTTFTSLGGTIEVMFNATAVVNSCGWDVSISAALATCDITCPAAISVDNDPGTCGALVTIPAPVLSGDGCATPVTLFMEDFNGCAQPTGWTVDAAGTSAALGACGVGAFAFDCVAYPSSSGGGPSAGFDGCVAVIDDDAAGNGVDGKFCIVSPVMDAAPAGVSGQSISFDWQNEAIGTDGDFEVDMSSDGTTWTNIFTAEGDSNGSELIDISATATATTQVRFCYDDDGGFNWGSAFDNVVVAGADVSAAVVTNDSPFATSTTDASGTYPVGTTTVTFSVTDAGGAVSTCTTDVTVTDTEAPVLNCPDDITVNLDPGACDAIVNFNVSATDNCDDPQMTVFSQLTDPVSIATVAINCNPSANNSFVRVWDLSTISANDFTMAGVNAYIQVAGQTVTANVYAYTGAVGGPSLTIADMTLLASGTATVTGAGYIEIPVSTVIPAGTIIAVEVATPIAFSMGVTNGGSSDLSYIRDANCGLDNPALLSSITAFPDEDYAFDIVQLTTLQDLFVQTAGPASGSTFPIGVTPVSFEITDFSGLTSTCTFNVVVEAFPADQVLTALACNDHVNISLDSMDCSAEITADMILEGGPYRCYEEYTVEIAETMDGPAIVGSPVIDGSRIGQTLIARVIDNVTGNTCWGTLLVEDKLPPVIECDTITIPCTASTAPNFGAVVGGTLSGSAANGVAIMDGATVEDQATVAAAPANAVVTNIEVDVNISHTWVGDLVISLEGPNGTEIQLFDACGNVDDMDATFTDAGNPVVCSGAAPGVMGLVAPDEPLATFNGASPSGTYTLKVEDTAAGDQGTINSFAVNVDYVVAAAYAPTASDACTAVTLEYDDVVVDNGCTGDFIQEIQRTWTATDASGNSSSCTQLIQVEKATLATLSLPPNFDDIDQFILEPCVDPAYRSNVAFGPRNWDQNGNGYPDLDEIPGPDGLNCGTIQATHEDLVIDICGSVEGKSSFKVLRKWTIVDWCTSEIATHTQIIKVLDKTPPTVTSDDITLSIDPWTCDASGDIYANVMDDCMGNVTVTTEPASLSNLPVGVYPVTITATDECGNTSATDIEVTVIDDSPPVAVCDQYTVVSLLRDGYAKIFAETFDDGSHDCAPVYFKVLRMDDEQADNTPSGSTASQSAFSCGGLNGDDFPSVSGYQVMFDDYAKFCCEDLGAPVMVIFRVYDVDPGEGPVARARQLEGGDLYGHYNDCMVEVEVQDKLGPLCIAPADITLDCDDPIDIWDLSAYGTGSGSDNCDATTEENINDLRECGVGRIIRTWTVTDGNTGNTSTCRQIITVVDNDPFVENDILWPRDYETNRCGANELDPDNLPARFTTRLRSGTEDNCSLVAITYEDEYTFEIVPDACFKVIRKWTVIDWCQFDLNQGTGIWSWTQILKVLDDDAPEITSSCDDVIFCDTSAVGCTGYANLTATAEDCVSSEMLNWSYSIDANDDGTYDINGNGSDASGYYPFGCHSILWRVEDGCGNESTCTYKFEVQDCKKPTPYCRSVATVLMPSSGSIELWASDLDIGSTDNCTDQADLMLSFSENPNQTNMTFTCEDLEDLPFSETLGYLYAARMYVTERIDHCDGTFHYNQDFCTVPVYIQDNAGMCDTGSASIAGLVQTEEQDNVEDVDVMLAQNGVDAMMFNTDASGQFSFFSLFPFQEYEVAPENLNEPLNGVSTYDLVLIQKHILGVQLLDSPYKIIAADINGSTTISALDMVELRKVILGIYPDFPNNKSWRFVEEAHTFNDPNSPFPFPETVTHDPLNGNMAATDFVGVKTGDVNGSVVANSLIGGTPRSGASLNLVVENQAVKAGQEVRVDVTASNFNTIEGYQFTMEVEGLDYRGVESGAITLDESNFGLTMLNRGMITTSWNSSEAITVAQDEVLFTVVFTASANIELSEALNVSSRYTTAEAYGAGETKDVSIAFNTLTNQVASNFELYQNEPNPFAATTVIGFNLPESASATITVYDVTGKVLRVVEGDYAKGYNEVTMKRNEISATGVLYYQLDTDEYSATKKMVIIE